MIFLSFFFQNLLDSYKLQLGWDYFGLRLIETKSTTYIKLTLSILTVIRSNQMMAFIKKFTEDNKSNAFNYLVLQVIDYYRLLFAWEMHYNRAEHEKKRLRKISPHSSQEEPLR